MVVISRDMEEDHQESQPILRSDERKDEEEEDEVQEESWWGWLVVLASFLCNMVIDGMGYSFGVLLGPMRDEFDSGVGKVAFVGSILTGVILLSAPVASACVNRLVGSMFASIGRLIKGRYFIHDLRRKKEGIIFSCP